MFKYFPIPSSLTITSYIIIDAVNYNRDTCSHTDIAIWI